MKNNVYFSKMTNWRFTRGVEDQTKAFLDGFNEVVPLQWLQYFDERELEVFKTFLFFFFSIFGEPLNEVDKIHSLKYFVSLKSCSFFFIVLELLCFFI